MIPEKFYEVLKYEGVVAIGTRSNEGFHMVNTWNSYLTVTADERITGPVGGMRKTEANLALDKNILMTLGSREVQGFNSKGTGFLITGTMAFITEGKEFETLKQKFPWARAMFEIRPESVTQTL